jgi:hypothetical protein
VEPIFPFLARLTAQETGFDMVGDHEIPLYLGGFNRNRSFT